MSDADQTWALRYREFSPPDQARFRVYEHIQQRRAKTESTLTLHEVFVVWFNYQLGGWKAMVATSLPDEMYYEVTYNRVAKETYVDSYTKLENVCIRDSELSSTPDTLSP